jgi:hypothetical protein
MSGNGNNHVVFDISHWRGITIIKCSDDFIVQLKTIFNLDEEVTKLHELIIKDMDDCLNSTEVFYNDSDEYSVMKFYQLNQIVMTKRYAFEIGESLFACLRHAKKDVHFVNTFFAFAKRLQNAAVGSQQGRDPRKI